MGEIRINTLDVYNKSVTLIFMKPTIQLSGKPNRDIRIIEIALDDYCEFDYDKYLELLSNLKKLVDECCKGHGVSRIKP